MSLKITLLLFMVVLSGCSSFKEPEFDFDKPLINIPEKPKEEKVWIDAKTSRLWVSPHIDENGDLVEGHYKYIVMQPGHWVIKSNEGKS